MRFLMFVCTDTEPVEAPTTPVPEIEEWVSTMDARGVRVTGDPLTAESQAKTVRVRRGKTAATDGPFIETKEVLAGFDLIECQDMAEAIEVAAAHPMAYTGVIELRAIREL